MLRKEYSYRGGEEEVAPPKFEGGSTFQKYCKTKAKIFEILALGKILGLFLMYF